MSAKPMTAENLGELLALVAGYGEAMQNEDKSFGSAMLLRVMMQVRELGESVGIEYGDVVDAFRKAKPRWVEED